MLVLLVLLCLPFPQTFSADVLFSDFEFDTEVNRDRTVSLADQYESCRSEILGQNDDERDFRPEYFDIAAVRPSARAHSVVSREGNRKWPAAQIPTKLQGGLSNEQLKRLACATKFFHAFTCIQFVTWSEADVDYVYITKNDRRKGCFTDDIGRIGGPQVLNLDASDAHCWKHGTILHEMMHVIGFFHEQARNDRDDHVLIHWKHIPEQYHFQFKKAMQINIKQDLLGEYDYGSIMHYSRFTFGSRTPVMTAKRPVEIQFEAHNMMGNRDRPTNMDITKLNLLYCPDSQDCVVSGWVTENECSVSCGGGSKTISREIIRTSVSDGRKCPALSKTIQCNTQPCPIDCETSKWHRDGPCSATCGVGVQKLKRKIVKPSQHGGKNCSKLADSILCNLKNCTKDCIVEVVADTPCSVTCGSGNYYRLRRIVQEASAGGVPCPTQLSLILPCHNPACIGVIATTTEQPIKRAIKHATECRRARTVTTDETFMESYQTPDVDDEYPWSSRRCDSKEDYVDGWTWVRLQGTGGNKIQNAMPPSDSRCGATWPGWINGHYPMDVDQIVQTALCYRSGHTACYERTRIDILQCGPDDYIYRLFPEGHCYMAFCTLNVLAPQTAETEWTYFKETNELYRLFTQSKSWKDANDHCETFGGSLVSINSGEENEFVLNTVAELSELCYLGAQKSQGRIWWADGTESNYTKWAPNEPNEPNNGGGNWFDVAENCISRKKGHKLLTWADINCNLEIHYICQIKLPVQLQTTGTSASWTHFKGKRFYHFVTTKMTWDESSAHCLLTVQLYTGHCSQ